MQKVIATIFATSTAWSIAVALVWGDLHLNAAVWPFWCICSAALGWMFAEALRTMFK